MTLPDDDLDTNAAESSDKNSRHPKPRLAIKDKTPEQIAEEEAKKKDEKEKKKAEALEKKNRPDNKAKVWLT